MRHTIGTGEYRIIAPSLPVTILRTHTFAPNSAQSFVTSLG
jgi:hypothetical protein